LIKIGDKVSVVSDDLEGIVVAFQKGIVSFETADGFVYKYPKGELVQLTGIMADALSNKRIVPKDKKQIKKQHKSTSTPVFDLHIEKIQARHKHLPVAQKLQIQLDEVRRILNKYKRKHYKEIILIHGQGKGVLRSEIIKILHKKGLQYTDADYTRYGGGALLVEIK